MAPRTACLVAAITLLLRLFDATAIAAASSPEQQAERVAAASMLSLGRAPTDDEAANWLQQGELSVADLMTRLRTQLERDATMRHAVVVKAFTDAHGRAPTAEEVRAATATTAAKNAVTYTDLVQQHMQSLRENPAEYARVIQRVYPFVVGRDAYPEEIDYWKKFDVLPYSLLVACVENWARRNQPGLMVTAGTPTVSINCDFLTTARLSPIVAMEARAALGIARQDLPAESLFAYTRGHNLVAPGTDDIVSAGRIHFVAALHPDVATTISKSQ